MSRKKRIRLIKQIDEKAIVAEKTYPEGDKVKLVHFPLDWWNKLKVECLK